MMEDCNGKATFVHTPTSRYRLAVSASDNRPIDGSTGKATIIGGDIYFSPNSARDVACYPQRPEELIYVRKTDQADVKDLCQPLWWSEKTAYLAFLPLVPDYGYPFSDLFNLTFRETRTTVIDGPVVINWKKLENLIVELLDDMRGHYGFPKVEPVMTTAVTSGFTFGNIKDFHEKVTRLRGWFTVWMAQLSYAIAIALAVDGEYQERDVIPQWIHRLCKHAKWDQAFVSGINSSVAQFGPDFQRVGLFVDILDLPVPLKFRYSIDFFVRFNVPVWYRWGSAEIAAAEICPEIARLAPLPDKLQQAATFLLRSPMTQQDRPWEAFFAERTRQEPFVISSESAIQTRKRLNRTSHQPENHTTNVYVWKKDLEGNYVREHIDKCRNAAILAEFGQDQKRYNPVFNEWDCGDDLGDLTEDEEAGDGCCVLVPQSHDKSDVLAPDTDLSLGLTATDISTSLETAPASAPRASTTWVTTLQVPDHAGSYEIEAYPVTQILYEYFGFVLPLPLPERYPIPSHNLLDNEVKQVCRILGIEQLDAAFTQSASMQYCFKFLLDLGNPNTSPPSAELFDLSPDNRLYVGSAARRHFVRRTSVGWFILDLPPPLAHVQWKLAVNNPIVVLFICRLDDKLSDYEICYILVQRGIEFHTFLPVQPVHPRPLPSLLTPIRLSDYTFTLHDYKLYLQDRERLLSNPRVRRAALMRGGIIWRLASSHVSTSEVLMGPTPSVSRHQQGISITSINPNEAYCDDHLDETEMDALCGLVHCFTGRGKQQQFSSWWPLDSTWRKDVEFPYWNERLESLVQGRLRELESGTARPLNATEWHRRIRSSSHVRRVFRNLGVMSVQELS